MTDEGTNTLAAHGLEEPVVPKEITYMDTEDE
jgi:hypothetical protein